jgi:hypothetical protein
MSRMNTKYLIWPVALMAVLNLTACEEDDPEPTPRPDMNVTPDQDSVDMAPDQDEVEDQAPDLEPDPDMAPDMVPDMEPDMMMPPMCTRPATDFTPGSATDGWDACISDGGAYVPFNMSISTVGRIAGFESIADLLWENPTTPDMEDFTAAREIYSVDNGLDSRVGRREDEHYAAVMKDGMVAACNTLTMAEISANPARCVGPALMQPLLIDAFQQGQLGNKPTLQAARIEAGLLWFLYISTHKEALTCAKTKADCDSGFAYYGGGEQRAGGLGLARYVKAADPEAHDYTFDGILAYRCWRDLDSADPAVNTALRDRGVNQMDRGLLRGVASVVVERLVELETSAGEAREADWAFVQILGGALVREAKARNVAAGGRLEAVLAKAAPTAGDVAELSAVFEATFPCP